jgi:hypothetical protein
VQISLYFSEHLYIDLPERTETANTSKLKPPKTHEERQAALTAALQKDPGVKHGSPRAFIVGPSMGKMNYFSQSSPDVPHRVGGVLLYEHLRISMSCGLTSEQVQETVDSTEPL